MRQFIGGHEEILRLDIQTLAIDFDMLEEVEGINIPEQCKVRMDYLLHPKPHLIKNGFDDVWFGVEVKSLKNQHDNWDFPKYKKLLWQCVTYRQSLFHASKQNIRPSFVLYYVGNDEYSGGGGFMLIREIETFVQLANVGRLKLASDGYIISFGLSSYYSRKRGRSATNSGIKLYVGTSGNDRGLTTE